MQLKKNITLIVLLSSALVFPQEEIRSQRSPFTQFIQQLIMGGITGVVAGATLEYVNQDTYYHNNFVARLLQTPDGKIVMPWVATIFCLGYFTKLCYEESVENIIPKLCSFLMGLKGGSIGTQKALAHNWSKWRHK